MKFRLLAVCKMDLTETRKKMEKVLEVVREDLSTIEVGRAKPSLVEKIKVHAYEGSLLTIRELANISVPDPQQVIISPWDKSIIKKIAQAISDSNLKLTPIVDEEMIRIRIPLLTEERRRELEKSLQIKMESGRKMIREVRNEAKSEIEKMKGEGGVSKDDIFEGLEDLQELHDEFIEKINGLGEEKKGEISHK